jgi:TetR/AcrR family transcriptional regulator, fatty acid metabolism regulator protein
VPSKNAKETKTKHDAILESAIKVFARKGFHQSRISEIAREAAVADGTIYLYFKNKDDILISLFEDKLEQIIRDLRAQIRREEDPIEKLRKFIQTHLDLVNRNPDLAAVLQVELRQSNKFMKEYVPAKFGDYLNLIAEIIREGQTAGLIRKDMAPGIVKRALFGALDEIALHSVLTHKGKEYLRSSADQICEMFLRGIAA